MNARLGPDRPIVLKTLCPGCRLPYLHTPSMAGRVVRCPTCDSKIVLIAKP